MTFQFISEIVCLNNCTPIACSLGLYTNPSKVKMVKNTITTIPIGLWLPQIFDGNVCSQAVCLLSFLPPSPCASCHSCQHTCKVFHGEPSSECTASLYLTAGEHLPDYSLTFDSSKSSSSCFSFSFCSGNLFYQCLSLLAAVFITLLIAIISQLLMIAGDIESNPGPKHGGENIINCS